MQAFPPGCSATG